MADQTPPGPKTSGRIAGVIAVVALILGGYYGVIARSAPPADGDAAKTEAAKTEANAEAPPPGVAAEAEAANEGASTAAGPSDSPATGDASTGDAASATAGAKPGAGGEVPSSQADAAAADSAAPDAPAGAAATEESGPSFDVVRVEPTGEAVIAGLAEPKATVELLDGAGPIADGVANERGEWAIVVEKPLAPGTHDLSIRTTSPDGKTQALSEQRVAIAVPEPGKGEALVVLNQPNAPSRVLQLPDAAEPAAGEAAATASNAPQDAAGEATPGPLADAAGGSETAPSAAAAKTADGAVPGTGSEDMAEAGTAAAGTQAEGTVAEGTTAGGKAADGTPATDMTADASGTPAADGAGAPAPGTTADAAATASGADAASASAAGESSAPGDTAVAAMEPQPAAPDAAASATESAGDAATGPAAMDLADTAASGDAAAKAGETTSAAAEPQPAPQPEPKVTVDAVEFENGRIYIAGSSATGGTVRIYVDGIAVGDVETGEGGRWLLESQRAMTPGRHTVRADQVNKATGEVIVRAEVPFEQQVDVAILSPVTTEGGGAEGASGSGTMPGPLNVIIRRGDNLWTISRRLYGKGIRYSTIYEANADQIRSPHLIYPGQIFMLPAGDARWTN